MKMIITITIAAMIAVFVLPNVLAAVVKVYPSGDAFVRSGNPNNNFNNINWGRELRVGHQSSFGTDRSYLKFDLTTIQNEEVTSAKLSLFALPPHQDDDPVAQLHYVSNDNWNENSITWNNKPAEGALISSQEVQTSGRMEFNVQQYVGENQLSFAIKEQGENELAKFYSKEQPVGGTDDEDFFWPYIEVEFEGGCEDGDLNCNGCVSQAEITSYAFNWLSGAPGISQSQVTAAAFNWLNGVNSC